MLRQSVIRLFPQSERLFATTAAKYSFVPLRSMVSASAPARKLQRIVRSTNQSTASLSKSPLVQSRSYSSKGTENPEQKDKRAAAAMYTVAAIIGAIGVSYAAVPLYRLFCQATGFGGTTKDGHNVGDDRDYTDAATPKDSRRQVTVKFTSQVHKKLPWHFVPVQKEIKVFPGEAALAFYTAENNSSQDVVGVSTYNVTPMKAGLYFNKIQCFCFEEQRLRSNEEIDMPVFFFIDKEFENDPSMDDVSTVTLNYTFFLASDTESIAESQRQGAILMANIEAIPRGYEKK
uniref:Uncharacterized protein n=1 Tax=Palpitomonas bilix TaxID=652834 RepID=A0A7S3D2Y2_9EUKA|mmetsp:Transcript_19905/g.50857  ORF Transcript_19905/g.50857 Transcript_19905/m.50857 type:complete len:289 (+) Transcript_19905:86-952(+)